MENEMLLKRKQELLEEIDKYNKLIFEDSEESKTPEFDLNYRKLNEEYEEVEKLIKKNHLDKAPKENTFLNNVSIFLLVYGLIMFFLCFYFIFTLICKEMVISFISMESVLQMNLNKQKALVLIAYLIYPITLLIIHIVMGVIFTRKQENKKVYWIQTIVLAVMYLPSLIIGLIQDVMPFLGI